MHDAKIEKQLVQAAIQCRENAYAPYSGFKVGAAVLGSNGKIYTGCNVENASYGAGICAERTALVKMVSDGCISFQTIAIVGNYEEEDKTAPCGICRQQMLEFCEGLDTTTVLLAGLNEKYKAHTLREFCPYPFMKSDLEA